MRNGLTHGGDGGQRAAGLEALCARIEAAIRERNPKDAPNGETHFTCPLPDGHPDGDVHPSARWNKSKRTWFCDVCGEGGGAKDLAQRLGLVVARGSAPSLETFSAQRRLTVDIVRTWGVTPTVHADRPAVRYPTPVGVDRVKYLDGGRPKYRWAARGGRVHWYGIERAVARLRDSVGVLYVVNGEPSVWAATARGVAAVCLCGGEGARLKPERLAELQQALDGLGPVALRVVYDVDAAGRAGAHRVVAALRAAAYVDVAALDLAVMLPDVPHADVDDLQRREGERLAEALATLPQLTNKATADEAAPHDAEGTKTPPTACATRTSSSLHTAVRLLDEVELFHTLGVEGEAYATVPIATGRITARVLSTQFTRWLHRIYFTRSGRPLADSALREVQSIAAAKAVYEGPALPVFLRVGQQDENLYLDLGDATGAAVEVTARGWDIVAPPPVRFRRENGMRELLPPERGGSIADLRPFVNLADERQWRLLVGWLVAALRPTGPFPILAVHGEHGSAKTTLTRLIRCLVDPTTNPSRAEPRDTRDLMVAARNAWVLSFDNLSHIRPWLSDALCRVSTGGGFATRELYTNVEEVHIDVVRPVVINGIHEVATRSDLLDRTIMLDLPAVPEDGRRPEYDLWTAFTPVMPRLLGALLDAAVFALRNQRSVQLPRYPRMADCVRWVTAAEPQLGWHPGAFLDAYSESVESADSVALEDSPVAVAVESLLATHDHWEGTATDLLVALDSGGLQPRARSWPRNAKSLSDQLRRYAPNFRRRGVVVEFRRTPGSRSRRLVCLCQIDPVPKCDACDASDAGAQEDRHLDETGTSVAMPPASQPALGASQPGPLAFAKLQAAPHGVAGVARPPTPCPMCRSRSWWVQDGGARICSVCNPKPSPAVSTTEDEALGDDRDVLADLATDLGNPAFALSNGTSTAQGQASWSRFIAQASADELAHARAGLERIKAASDAADVVCSGAGEKEGGR
jgi:hypothetical protein